MAKTVFEVQDVKKVYKVPGGNDVHALNGVSLTVKENEFICVVGPSGCGKTTLLNIVAGLEPTIPAASPFTGSLLSAPGQTARWCFSSMRCTPG